MNVFFNNSIHFTVCIKTHIINTKAPQKNLKNELCLKFLSQKLRLNTVYFFRKHQYKI